MQPLSQQTGDATGSPPRAAPPLARGTEPRFELYAAVAARGCGTPALPRGGSTIRRACRLAGAALTPIPEEEVHGCQAASLRPGRAPEHAAWRDAGGRGGAGN